MGLLGASSANGMGQKGSFLLNETNPFGPRLLHVAHNSTPAVSTAVVPHGLASVPYVSAQPRRTPQGQRFDGPE